MIDYTWRQDLNLTMDCSWDRRKIILDVQNVKAVNIHFHGRDPMFAPEIDELHVNHYQRKDNGVFNMKYDWLRAPDIIEDTRLRDEYRDRIVNN